MARLAAANDNEFAERKTDPVFIRQFLNSSHKIVDVTAENIIASLNVSFDLENNTISIGKINNPDQIPIAFHAIATYYDLYIPYSIKDWYVENYTIMHKNGELQFTKPRIIICQDIPTPENEFLLDGDKKTIDNGRYNDTNRIKFRQFNEGTDYIITKHNELSLDVLLGKFNDYCRHKISVLVSLASNPIDLVSDKTLLLSYETLLLTKKARESCGNSMINWGLSHISVNKNTELPTEKSIIDYINSCLKEFQKQHKEKDDRSHIIQYLNDYSIREDKYRDIYQQLLNIQDILGDDFTSRIDLQTLYHNGLHIPEEYTLGKCGIDKTIEIINHILIENGYDNLCINIQRKESLFEQIYTIIYETNIRWVDDVKKLCNFLKENEAKIPLIIDQVNQILQDLAALYKQNENINLSKITQELRVERKKKIPFFDQILDLFKLLDFPHLYNPDIVKYMIEKDEERYRKCIINILNNWRDRPYTHKTTKEHNYDIIRQHMWNIWQQSNFLAEDALFLFKKKSLFIVPLFIKQYSSKQFDHFLRKTKELNLIWILETDVVIFFDYKISKIRKIFFSNEESISREYTEHIPEKIRREFWINSREYYKQLHRTNLYNLLTFIEKNSKAGKI
jgi:hypothetical protein